ncbi:MAG TPA: phosphate/phosphite/phosphonate ABC transporter substrate-binding protein [Anaerolineaceae bacterium]|nr:phosphate/phosphite/phosphonate ABC transporter substrate-binding protein [Anaerolineaceae bacterium]
MSKNRLFAFGAILIIAALALTACKTEVDPWENIGTEENPIIFVAVPSGETERVLASFETVADLVYADTGLVIEPFVATSYAAAIEAMCAEVPQAHMGALATFSYILAHEKGCADAALVSTRFGAAFYTGQFIVRSDSGIETLADLAGKTYCRVDETSTSGWIIPSIQLKAAGIDPETDLAGIVDAGSHDAVAAAVYNGDCDFGTTYVDARSTVEETYPDIMDATKVIQITAEIPNDGFQFHPDFPADIRATLIAEFLHLFETEEGAAAMDEAYQYTGMEEHGDEFYDAFRQILDAAGMDYAELSGG